MYDLKFGRASRGSQKYSSFKSLRRNLQDNSDSFSNAAGDALVKAMTIICLGSRMDHITETMVQLKRTVRVYENLRITISQ